MVYICLPLGEFPQAVDNLEQALKITREIGDRQGEVYMLNNLRSAYDGLHEFLKAEECCEQALKITREIEGMNRGI